VRGHPVDYPPVERRLVVVALHHELTEVPACQRRHVGPELNVQVPIRRLEHDLALRRRLQGVRVGHRIWVPSAQRTGATRSLRRKGRAWRRPTGCVGHDRCACSGPPAHERPPSRLQKSRILLSVGTSQTQTPPRCQSKRPSCQRLPARLVHAGLERPARSGNLENWRRDSAANHPAIASRNHGRANERGTRRRRQAWYPPRLPRRPRFGPEYTQ